MLLQFNFKNFKSFRDDTVLDLGATKISEFNNHVVNFDNEKVLPVAGIYGANASGKSNVYDAFKYMHDYVLNSFAFLPGNENFLKPTPFLFDSDSKNKESSFEVYFIDNMRETYKIYNYGFSIDKDGVCEEWLNYKAKTSREGFKRIFYRNRNELDFSGINESSRKNIKLALGNRTLIVSLGARLQVDICYFIYIWFLNNSFANFGLPFEDLNLSQMLPLNFADDKKVQDKVVRFLSTFDSSIKGFEVDPIKVGNETKYRIYSIHDSIDGNDQISIPFSDESSGTLKMFSLYPMMQKVLESGGVFFADELNSKLHPLLVRSLIIAFMNPDINTKHAQLIFTSHDAWQLNSNMLRRDEIWFAEKDHSGLSILYSLADFIDEDGNKIRKDENQEKNYLLGKYGAIPELKDFDMF